MRIDDTRVVPDTARCFRSFDGQYGVKMTLARKSGLPLILEGIAQEFLFGSFSEHVARRLANVLNNADPDKKHKSAPMVESSRAAAAKPSTGAA